MELGKFNKVAGLSGEEFEEGVRKLIRKKIEKDIVADIVYGILFGGIFFLKMSNPMSFFFLAISILWFVLLFKNLDRLSKLKGKTLMEEEMEKSYEEAVQEIEDEKETVER